MSKTETETKTAGRKKTGKFSRTITFYTEAMELVEAKVEGIFVSATTLEEAYALLGNDQTAILAAINDSAKSKMIEAQASVARGQGLDEKAVMKFIRPYLSIPPYSELEDAEKGTGLKALLEQVKNTPFMVAAIRAKSAEADEDND